MRASGRGFLLLWAAVLAFPATAGADSIVAEAVVIPEPGFRDPGERMLKTKLSNGLVVLTLEDHTTPVVSFQMWVKVGSRDESRYTGLAHLFEHMMFRGSSNIPPDMHAQLVNSRGGRTNAYTSRDFTVYFEDVTSEVLPLVIELEAERLANLDISEKNLESERQVVLEERRMRTEDQPMGRAMEALMALTFQAHPYRWPPIGWRSDVERATVAASREFFDSYYAPNNVVIAIAGDFDSEEALDLIRRTFGKLDPVEVPRNPTQEPEQDGERRAIVHFDLGAPILAAAWHAPPTGHADGEALDVLSTILSSGRSSRLYRKLVYEKESALSAEGAYWELDDAGIFYAVAQVRPGVGVEDVEGLFMAEIERVKQSGVRDDELAKAKRQLEVALVNSLATNHSLAGRMGREVSTFGRVRPLDERLTAIRAVTGADVQRVANTYLKDEKRSVVHVVPPPASERKDRGDGT
ncbi:MAG: pitrilysin family protein [Myxococcota bacterium]|jgi:predicted Zn-dependent peptidase|nr:insulinase family protein [bacterium]MDP6074140.1 pitrilysin family protein [Myxococcota bacterium]MDP6241789.1 pitrilysin family protein [Myxococcota bacterium]MDP7074575.1 pitrilysin family protein [Myxococcota bacterium]MDP7299453.1 pitrilysin family protein [Myxococcota bacterium]